LAVALAESCFSSYSRNAVGARIDLSEHAKLSGIDQVVTLLFAESPSRIILSVKLEDAAAVRAIADQSGVACSTIGETGGPNLSFKHSGKTLFQVEIATLEEDWRNALPSHLDRPAQMAAD
jgi:phosphoribosylformylglycinamidine (FGAM) synthase-like enzyme